MFLPTTIEEMRELKWDELDVILVTGDAYIDSSYIGCAIIGHVLVEKGYRVGIIAQPDMNSRDDILRLGEPLLFWGVTSGCVDSMVANYTALMKRRMQDDLTAGGRNTKRPDRALIAYSNLIRRYSRSHTRIILGGIEASLRRVAHYDYWDNRVRRSILLDAKADMLVYGMGEKAVVEIAERLKAGEDLTSIDGVCWISKESKKGFRELPSFKEVSRDSHSFERMFKMLVINSDPLTAKGLTQKHGSRYLIHNPPALPVTPEELGRIYELPYERDLHPFCRREGEVRALDTIRFSITSHRGCYGECNFCAIALHQGRTVISRSEESIIREASKIVSHPDFKGFIYDVGGPTANMYGIECKKKLTAGSCRSQRCLFPSVCKGLKPDHGRQKNLLKRIRKIQGIKKVFVASGIRYDLILADKKEGMGYMEEIVAHHVSGQMKIAPEHSAGRVLQLMGKPSTKHLLKFRQLFNDLNRKIGKKQFLTYYFIAAHPGCTMNDMIELRKFTSSALRHYPEQVQIFTPTPSTFSTLMYYTGRDPFSGEAIYVERDRRQKEKQKNVLKKKREVKTSFDRLRTGRGTKGQKT